MKSAAPKKPASAKPVETAPSKSRAGDMDYLERYEEKPMPAVFEQIDRTYKRTHSFFGWPFAIV